MVVDKYSRGAMALQRTHADADMVDRQAAPLGLTMQQAELLVRTHLDRGASPQRLTALALTDARLRRVSDDERKMARIVR
jgi:hypothetical protein